MHAITLHYTAGFLLSEGKASRPGVQLLQPKQLYRLEFQRELILPSKSEKLMLDDVMNIDH